MENFLVSLRAVFPMFAIMSIGYLVRRQGMLDETSLKKMNSVCFQVFLTAVMFRSIYQMDLKTVDGKLLAFGLVSILIMMAVSYLLVMRLEKENKRRGVLIQALYRSNFVVLGFPVVSAVYGEAGLGVPAMMTCITTPLYNVVSVLVLSYFQGSRPKPLALAKEVIRNPYILATIVGFGFHILGIRLPSLLEDVVDQVAGVGNPLAIFILGASFSFGNISAYKKYLTGCCLMRLVVFPGIFLSAAVILGFRGVELLTLVALFATPTAIASHVMAQHFNGDSDLAGVEVVISTLVSLVTLFLWIFCFKSFGLLPAV